MTLSVQNVSRSFGRRPVLKGIQLTLEPGQRLGLLGPNGSGKTTLLRLCAGTLRPTEGDVQFDGASTMQPDGRRGVAFVSQEAPVYAELTVLEHVQWWASVNGKTPAGAEALLDDAGLHRFTHASSASLSRGQRQRLALCMALATKPRLLLLDEPTTALDTEGRDWLVDQLKNSDAAMLLATHETDLVDALGLETRHLNGGRLQ